MSKLVFWLDIDNTLLDNDYAKDDLDRHLQVELGQDLTQRFWDLYEEVRKEKDIVDIPLALQRLRERTPLAEMDEQTYQHIHSLFDNYPFYDALYPNVIETLQHLNTQGTTVIVSDGDLYFQAEKIFSSGLADLVQGRVLLYAHKQQHLEETMQRYPGDHYIMIDDKPEILLDSKRLLDGKITTVFVRQGKYAAQVPEDFQPDIAVDHIGDLCLYEALQFLPRS
ncbi:MAG: HAD family hydrolase [Ktedonobacteraceae bacterium]|nr:HAD family hydrolase [Ktedonobacteraceae bacterium]MBO0792752.1 HAD family hydrolase [Ktedonobacteraceae bacterium]